MRNVVVFAAVMAANLTLAPTLRAQAVAAVEVTPSTTEAGVGERVSFTATARDSAGRELDLRPTAWVAIPFDLAAADSTGTVTVYGPGIARVAAIVGGQAGFATVTIRPAPVTRIDLTPLSGPLVVGGTVAVGAIARTATGVPREDVALTWSSDAPAVAVVDPTGAVTGLAPGGATVTATAEEAEAAVTIEVVENPVQRLVLEPRSSTARAGDVLRLEVTAEGGDGRPLADPFVRWSVTGEGATIEPGGAFVAERPGRYTVTATSGDRVAVGSVAVTPREADRLIQVVGRTPVSEHQAAEQWIAGDFLYLSSIADRVWVYDISDPAHPVKTDSIMVDARTVNDVSLTPDGRIGVLTREGASDRRNGIVFFDASDPAHPKVVSEYTETVTGGVHSAFIDDHYVYLTDDATGSLRVIDFADLEAPREVARWQVENPLAGTIDMMGQMISGGRYLHDVQVVDGLAYLAYWKDGLVILDVGNGIRGGSPESPQFVSQLRFNHRELYGPEWLSGTHEVFRYKNYVFVGDEVFPPTFDISGRTRLAPRGIVHVVDVTDIEAPRKVAEYPVPEAGAHNMWVQDDLLVMGYYGGGGRVLDVSGELSGNLYAQGREVASLWTGDPEGYRPNLPLTWGARWHGDLILFNDINSGVWITRLGEPIDRGTTTSPPF
ncbi:MAG TPA: Ig-like domain-containing protein [Gemmatimonadota bacterium]|nr:Ig-like domain-containing protein [Gemmatimonadota bacterium]